MKFRESRGTLVALSLFMVVALTLTWLVYVSLRHDVEGRTASYSALFTDVYGLREGDDVRMAGVRVGRVEKIEHRREIGESLIRRAAATSDCTATP